METLSEFGLEEIIYENEVFKGPSKINHEEKLQLNLSIKGQFHKRESTLKIILKGKLQLNLI